MKIASFLAAHARQTPGKDAVICGDERLTFAELHETTDRLANSLRSLGVGVGDRVALQLQNTVEFVRAFMAVTKAGGISVPVNTRLAPGEIAYILADSAPKAVFLSDETREVFDRAATNAQALIRTFDAYRLATLRRQPAPRDTQGGTDVVYDKVDDAWCVGSGSDKHGRDRPR